MGHELGGEIVAVGSQADGWREGTNVAVLPVVSCGACQYCQSGLVSHCAQARYIGMGPAGGLAEFAVGRPELVQACQPAPRPRGRLVISGACVEPTTIEPITALLKELTIRYSVAYRPDEFREVIDAFADGGVDPSPTVGPTFGLDRIGEAFAVVRAAQVPGRVAVAP